MDRPRKENVVADFLSRLATQNNELAIDDSFLDEHLFAINTYTPWYANIANYLVSSRVPPYFSPQEKRLLIEKSFPFSYIARWLYYIGPNHVMRRCVREYETYGILHACHDEPCGGHFATKRTSMKILNTGYCWPTLHKDAIKYTKKCDRCQRMGRPTKFDKMPL